MRIHTNMTAKTDTSDVIDWMQRRDGRIFGFPHTPTTPQDIIDVTEPALCKQQQLIIANQNLRGSRKRAAVVMYRIFELKN